MSYYLPLVLINSVGLSNSMSRLLSACNATSYFVFACVAVIMVERFGRRGLMLMSTFGQFACFLIITILLRYAENDARYGTASVAFFFLYYIAFGIGMLGVPWLYPTEVNSLPMRTKGAAVSSALRRTGMSLSSFWSMCLCIHNTQDHEFCHCRNHTYRDTEHWVEILDRVDYHERGFSSDYILPVPGDR
jgi:hypothetical protein